MENNASHTFNVTGIYMIYNNISKKSYIGSAVNIYKRIFGSSSWSHLKALTENRHINIHLQNAYNKHGVSVFSFRILEICNKESLLIREQFYLDSLLHAQNPLKFRKKAYNICPTAGSPLGRKMSTNTKTKLSKSKLGIKNPMYGKKGSLHPRSIVVLQYDSKGMFICKFSNAEEASNQTGISINSIRNSILKGYKGGNYYWKNFNGTVLKSIYTKQTLSKELSATSLDNSTSFTFKSFKEASVHFKMERKAFSNAVRKAIRNKSGVYKNYIWKEIN
jgi:group I intron endonuclease